MNKRIKQKKRKAAYKIPKYILRLTKKWTHLDDSMLYWAAFGPQKEHHVPKKMMVNFIRKYRRIHFFLNDLEGEEIFRSGFFISREAYGIIQFVIKHLLTFVMIAKILTVSNWIVVHALKIISSVSSSLNGSLCYG